MPSEHQSPQAVVERFLRANDALDVDAMFEEIGSDVVWSFPTAPPGAPRELRGKTNNRSFFESIRPMWMRFSLPHREVHPLSDDPDRVLAYYSSTGSLLDGGPYSNSYLSLVTVRAGKIQHWIEYCDPTPLVHGIAALRQSRQHS